VSTAKIDPEKQYRNHEVIDYRKLRKDSVKVLNGMIRATGMWEFTEMMV